MLLVKIIDIHNNDVLLVLEHWLWDLRRRRTHLLLNFRHTTHAQCNKDIKHCTVLKKTLSGLEQELILARLRVFKSQRIYWRWPPVRVRLGITWHDVDRLHSGGKGAFRVNITPKVRQGRLNSTPSGQLDIWQQCDLRNYLPRWRAGDFAREISVAKSRSRAWSLG